MSGSESDDADICGSETANGEPCHLSASRADGRCHHHTTVESEQARGGRPSKFDAVRDDILAGARQGMTIEGCARLAGVHKSTLYDWLDSREGFAPVFRRARAQGELKHLLSVDERGSRFILERSYGYTKTERREVDANYSHEHDVADRYTELVGAASGASGPGDDE